MNYSRNVKAHAFYFKTLRTFLKLNEDHNTNNKNILPSF